MLNEFPEKHDSLWWVAASPAIWAAHFLLSYSTAAIWCAKYAGADASLSSARIAIGAFTAFALAAVAVVAWRGFQQYRAARSKAAAEADSPAGRHHSLGFTLLSLSGLSALAIVYAGLAAVFIGSCH